MSTFTIRLHMRLIATSHVRVAAVMDVCCHRGFLTSLSGNSITRWLPRLKSTFPLLWDVGLRRSSQNLTHLIRSCDESAPTVATLLRRPGCHRISFGSLPI